MKISHKFRRFEDENVLVIVSGTEEAKIYQASDGEFRKLCSIRSPNIHYSDKEGFFAVRTKGIYLGGGAVRDNVEKKEKEEFLNMLEAECKKFSNQGFDYIALLAPEQAIPKIIRRLDFFKNKIKIAGKGVYLDYSPEKLLDLITKSLKPLA